MNLSENLRCRAGGWVLSGRVPRLLFERAESLRQARVLKEVVEHVYHIVPPSLGQRRQAHRHRRTALTDCDLSEHFLFVVRNFSMCTAI